MTNSQATKSPKANEFAIAHNPFRKKQDQEQKRFLRRSHGEDSRKPVAIHANQAIQKSKIKSVKSKAVYAKGERTIPVEITSIPKANTPAPRQAKTDRQAKKIKQECQTTKKNTQEATTEPLQD